MYNQANQITKAVCDMTPQEKEELLKALTMEQKDASAMDASSVLDVLETDDTAHANIVSLASSSLQKIVLNKREKSCQKQEQIFEQESQRKHLMRKLFLTFHNFRKLMCLHITI
jgi:hypothetical protein